MDNFNYYFKYVKLSFYSITYTCFILKKWNVNLQYTQN